MLSISQQKEALLKIIYNSQQLINQMSHVIFFKDANFVYSGCNHNLVRFARLHEAENVIDRTDYEMPWAEDIDFYRKIDASVLQGEEKRILMQVRVATGEKAPVVQRKIPIRDVDNGAVLGIMAIMTEINDSELNAFLNKLNHIDNSQNADSHLINPQYCFEWYKQYHLTERESEFLFYLLRGMTSKMIARVLGVSPRTIEKFSLSVRHKMGCFHKSELIEKAIKDGVMRFIPPSIDIKKIIMLLE